MRTGKLMISRGSHFTQQGGGEPKLTRAGSIPYIAAQDRLDAERAPIPVTLPAADDRLGALERLARLRSMDLLTAEEFKAAKAVILAGQPEDAVSRPSSARAVDGNSVPRSSAGPSLAESLFSWKFLPVGLVAGLALSFGAQPQETIRWFDEALRTLGA